MPNAITIQTGAVFGIDENKSNDFFTKKHGAFSLLMPIDEQVWSGNLF